MDEVLSKKMRKFYSLIEEFADGADGNDDVMITIELHIAGTAKTLKWDFIETANLVKSAAVLQTHKPKSSSD